MEDVPTDSASDQGTPTGKTPKNPMSPEEKQKVINENRLNYVKNIELVFDDAEIQVVLQHFNSLFNFKYKNDIKESNL